MRVRVLFFGLLTDVVSRREEEVDLKEGARISDLIGHYTAAFPQLRPLLPSVAVSVNREYAPASTVLRDQDEVALLPPVSGGSGPVRTEVARVEIVRQKIDVQLIANALKHASDGACAVFEGIVRDNTRGRRTLYLDYEAYEEMALKQMSELREQALQKFAVRDIALVHRLGRLQIGETSVLIVVASAHRAAAFEACRWLIDTLKKTVPIWKKEYFEDGAVWADGDPFPPEISTSQSNATPPGASK
jgi:molybdopterin synthase catalytic subunit/molybdopterin converting factor small subunit